jgi:hypothetical protein
MILDTELFAATKPYSMTKILCRCDECGQDRLVLKSNITKRGETLCLKCTRNVKNWWRGRKQTPEHSRNHGLARIGHHYGTPESKAKARARFTAARNPRWNPDRAEVARNETVRRSMYSLLWKTLYRVGRSKEGHTEDLLGYSAAELAAHLEAQFVDGMSWEDRSAWHIDHIKPVREFAREGVTDPAIINALSNLRPLWARENMSLAGQRYGRKAA